MARPVYSSIKTVVESASAKTPAATSIGDELIAFALLNKASGTITFPAGWTQIGSTQEVTGGGSETFVGAFFRKEATEAGEKTVTVTFSATAVYRIVSIANITGSIGEVLAALQANNSSSKNLSFASVNPGGVAEGLSLLCGLIDQTGTGTPPTGWTERQDNEVGAYLATKELPNGEATGAQTVTLTTARFTIAGHIVILPKSEGKEHKLELTDTPKASESVTKAASKAVSESATASESVAKASSKAITESLAASESVGKEPSKAISDTATAAEEATEVKGTGHSLELSDTASAGESIGKAPTKALTSTPTTSESTPAKAVGKAITDKPQAAETFEHEGGSEAEPAAAKPRRKPPTELDVEIETATRKFRLPADSQFAKELATSLSFDTARGEGFSTGSATVARDILRDYPDLNLLDTWRFILRNGDVVYEGLVHSMPRTNNPEPLITINLVGWMTYLKGRKISTLIIDRRLSGWSDPSTQRKANLVATYRFEGSMSTGTQAEGEAGPAIIFSFQTFDSTYKEIGEAALYAGGEDISDLRFDFKQLSTFGEDTTWFTIGALSSDDLWTSSDQGTDLNNVSHEGEVVEATESGRKYAMLQTIYEGAVTGTSNNIHAFVFPRIIGNHGLEAHGEEPEEGYYLSDIARYILESDFPKIDTSGIEDNSFIVKQATWHDAPTTGYDAIQTLDNLIAWETNIWEDRTFYLRPADLTRYDWQIRTDDPGVTVNFQGDSIENFANGVPVSFTDILTGKVRTLYPTDHEELRDESESNPANIHGVYNWADIQSVPWPCFEEEALQYGRTWLAIFNRPRRPGQYTIGDGYIKDIAGHWHQASKVRSSQTLGIMDLLTDEPRLIYATSWDQPSLSLTITVDATPTTLEAIVARQQVELEAKGLA